MTSRRAIEALRSGVPNRDAVTALGCMQPDIETKFRTMLDQVSGSLSAGTGVDGLLVAGEFGSGKSHLLEYLQHVSLSSNFVCSKVVISKETPLYDPRKLFIAAVEGAAVPGRRGQALTEITTKLNFNSPRYAEFYQWVNQGLGKDLNKVFAATLFLFERLKHEHELMNKITRFWAGGKISMSEVKRYLRLCGQGATYKLEKWTPRDIAHDRFTFVSRLMVAAGYTGWVLLIDEVELIGRYSFTQRARSYAELARLMGRFDSRIPGLITVMAITNDFDSAVLEEKNDLEKIPGKLRGRAADGDLLLAGEAEMGMKIIQKERQALRPPDAEDRLATHNAVRDIYTSAYAWNAPDVMDSGATTSTRMREYVKRWITEWDLTRLDPSYKPNISADTLAPSYGEDKNLEIATEEAGGDEGDGE
ncbi:MAG TPA: BREX system ATP-binding domain-containing protein [Thermoanaerobaculia bacterium]|nr:BREX system ATP-binding domain-containing protein [Thermoanaerobaculia bacterium]